MQEQLNAVSPPMPDQYKTAPQFNSGVPSYTQPPMQQVPQYTQPPSQQIIVQQVVQQSVQQSPSVVVTNSHLINCCDICCQCQAPNLGSFWNCCCGIANLISPGWGLFWGSCCAQAPASCCSVCCAGNWQFWSFPFIFGCVSSCIVGCKMCGGCSRKN